MAMETVFYDGRPIFEAANSKELAKAVEAFDDDVKPPYVVRIPEGATEVVDSAFFEDKTIGTVLLPCSVTTIEECAFWSCTNLRSIFIPNSVKEIKKRAFEKCTNLTEINIPESVTMIGPDAFSGCVWLTSINISPNNDVYDSREDCNLLVSLDEAPKNVGSSFIV